MLCRNPSAVDQSLSVGGVHAHHRRTTAARRWASAIAAPRASGFVQAIEREIDLAARTPTNETEFPADPEQAFQKADAELHKKFHHDAVSPE